MIVHACKGKRFGITSYFLLLNICRKLGKSEQKKFFVDHRTTNTIQLFVAIKGNIFGIFFFWTSHSKGKFPREVPQRLSDIVASYLFDCTSLKRYYQQKHVGMVSTNNV